MRKTGKRETALACLGFLGALGMNAAAADWFNYPAANTLSVLGILAAPVMIFVGGMFGLDSYAKQIVPQQENETPPANWPPNDEVG